MRISPLRNPPHRPRDTLSETTRGYQGAGFVLGLISSSNILLLSDTGDTVVLRHLKPSILNPKLYTLNPKP